MSELYEMNTEEFKALSTVEQALNLAKKVFGRLNPDTPIVKGMFDTPEQAIGSIQMVKHIARAH